MEPEPSPSDTPSDRDAILADMRSAPDIRQKVAIAAKHFGLEPEYLLRLIGAESHYRQSARSHKGAIGVGQLMPSAARELGINPHDVDENILGSVMYARMMHDEFDNDPVLATAAYNAGPEAVRKYGGIPPYAETRDYVRKVLGVNLQGNLGLGHAKPRTIGLSDLVIPEAPPAAQAPEESGIRAMDIPYRMWQISHRGLTPRK